MTNMIKHDSLMERREMIRQKLTVMQECYQARDIRNYDRFLNAFHANKKAPVIIGTDSGAWFDTPERVEWLIRYDWSKWGDVSIDPLGFELSVCGRYDFVKVKGSLDFHQGVWDLNIYLIFDAKSQDYSCEMMQFTVPRNLVTPTVIINRNESLAKRHAGEFSFLESCTSALNDSSRSTELCKQLIAELEARYRSRMEIELSPAHIMIHTENDGGLYYAGTGVMTNGSGDRIPYRLIGVGIAYGDEINRLSWEISRPFFCRFG